MDLEAAEFFVRSSVLGLGARVLEEFLAQAGPRAQAPVCAENHVARRMRSDGWREKTLRTILGPVRWGRARWVCPACGAVAYPDDALLGVAHTGFSPGAQRMMARTGASECFAQAAEDLELYADLSVGAKDVERVAEAVGRQAEDWMRRQGSLALATQSCAQRPADAHEEIETFYVSFDGTGTPMRASELHAVPGKNGVARTREVKLGCVFTQTGRDQEGRPVRDEGSTTYVGAIEESMDFGHRIHAEAVRRGMAQAPRVVALSDGAAYNKTILAEHFPHATAIIDLYHAHEHLADFIQNVARQPLQGPLHRRARRALKRGHVEALLRRLRAALPASGPRRRQGLRQIAYFHKNAPAMRYGRFRKEGLFIGSGVIEAGCKTLVGKRLKQSGMFWSLRGANAIIALRCCIRSHRFEQFWEDQAA